MLLFLSLVQGTGILPCTCFCGGGGGGGGGVRSHALAPDFELGVRIFPMHVLLRLGWGGGGGGGGLDPVAALNGDGRRWRERESIIMCWTAMLSII